MMWLVMWVALMGPAEIPDYFVAIHQDRTLYGSDEPVLIRFRLGNHSDSGLKRKKFPDILGGLKLMEGDRELARVTKFKSEILYRKLSVIELNAHHDFRLNLVRLFPEIKKGGVFQLSYTDENYHQDAAPIKVLGFPVPDLEAVYRVHTSKGTFDMTLAPQDAPDHARYFALLVKDGYYTDMIFHRVIRKKVIQSGDPTGTGEGGSGYNLALETSPFLKHRPMVVGMARRTDVNSASGQFYVCLQSIPELDNEYSLFASVIAGEDVVREIGDVGTTGPTGSPPDRPFDDIVLKQITIEPKP